MHEKKEAGNDIIIIGDAKHPEVMGINGWCENSAWITDNTEDAEKNVIGMDKNKCYVVVVQTTFRESKDVYKRQLYMNLQEPLFLRHSEIKYRRRKEGLHLIL